jgi:uncharacterized protein YkwD
MVVRRSVVILSTLIVATVILAGSALAATATRAAIGHGHRVTAHGCADANTPATAAPRQAMQAAVACLVNEQRVRRHLPALQVAQDLGRSAQGWANAMTATGRFTHGVNFAARISAAGYTWSSAGENIAAGFQTPWQVVKAWMASPDHCQNILSPTFSDVGTGISTRRLGNVGPATWTQDFGLRIGHRAPSGNTGPQHGCPYTV